MSAIGALVSVGTVAALTGLAANAITSVIAQNAAKEAAAAQEKAANKGIKATNAAVDEAQAGLDPYAQTGADALQRQRDLDGLNGPAAQQAAINQISSSPLLQAQMDAQSQGILANASATGGLRGGNVQQALAQNRSQLLTDAINQQYGQFAGLSQSGQNAATNQGQFGMQGAGNVADLYGARGQAQAGGTLGVANAQIQGVNGAANGITSLIRQPQAGVV